MGGPSVLSHSIDRRSSTGVFLSYTTHSYGSPQRRWTEGGKTKVLGKINLAEIIINIPAEIRNAFKKGQIDKLYRLMYEEADRLSAIETQKYLTQKKREYIDSIGVERERKGSQTTVSSFTKPLLAYKNRRLKYHLDKMTYLLELYVQSKQSCDKQ